VEKRSPKICATSEIVKELPKVNKNAMGEHSPNLVTLFIMYTDTPHLICDGIKISLRVDGLSDREWGRFNKVLPTSLSQSFFVSQLSRLMYVPHGRYRDAASVALYFMPGVEHLSILVQVALAPRLKLSILDKSFERIIHGYKSMSIDTIRQRLYDIFGGGCLPIIKI
jgi:hypothetical protein